MGKKVEKNLKGKDVKKVVKKVVGKDVKIREIDKGEMKKLIEGLPDWSHDERKKLAGKYRGFKYTVDGKRVDGLVMKIKEDGEFQWILYYMMYRECGKGKRTRCCSKLAAAACIDKTGRHGIWISDEIDGMKIAHLLRPENYYLVSWEKIQTPYGWRNRLVPPLYINNSVKNLVGEVEKLGAFKYISIDDWVIGHALLDEKYGNLILPKDDIKRTLTFLIERLALYLEYPQAEFIFKLQNTQLREWMLDKLIPLRRRRHPEFKFIKELIAVFRLCIKHKNPLFDPHLQRWENHEGHYLALWYDYIHGLWKLKADLRNPHYFNVNSVMLNYEHDKAMERLRREREREMKEMALLELEKRAAREREDFMRMKKRFIGLKMVDQSGLEVMTLNSPEEYIEESMAMHNCIAALKYYLRKDSLILVARENGRRVADIELSLITWDIKQCFGPCNSFTPFDGRIRKLISENLDEIKRRYRCA